MVVVWRNDVVAALPQISRKSCRLVEGLPGKQRTGFVGRRGRSVHARPEEARWLHECVEQECAVAGERVVVLSVTVTERRRIV